MIEVKNTVAPLNIVNADACFYNDAMEKKQWYLDGSTVSPLSIDVYSVWKDYTGTGVKIGVIDSQIDFRHTDLRNAYDAASDYNFALATGNVALDTKNLPLYHGTAVAGVIAAEAGNAFGTVGIAPGATLVGLAIDYSSADCTSQILAALNQSAELDVVNNSWSFSTNFSDDFRKNPEFQQALVHAVSAGRDGLGTSVVFAAGNAGVVGSSNYHNFQNSPYTIAVGAVDPTGTASSFTSVGANVLLSAPGSAILTTTLNDRFDTVNGTSFAAPAVAAAIGLMLEANPDLGYRDVQEILAYSAQRTGLADTKGIGDGWRTNGATNFNGGGLHFSDAYGFGFLNVHDAVRLAETWTSQQTYANLATVTQTVALNKTLVAGSQDHISVSIDVAKAIDLEHVQVSMDLKWAETGDLDVYLVSPDGTQVRLVYDLPSDSKVGSIRNFTFDSVASLGEQSAGTWTLEIYNRNPAAVDKAGVPSTGSLQGVTLTLTGNTASNDDTYIYTDEFGTLYAGADLTSRSVLKDTNGGTDAINAAAVTTNSTIDLSAKGKTVIAGITLSLGANVIENAYAGDGNDTLTGSSVANILSAGRGDDVVYFSFGNDKVDGGQGQDKLVIDATFGSITGYVTSSGELAISVHAGEVTKISNVETFVFNDVTYSFTQIHQLLDAAGGSTDAGTETPPTSGTDTSDGGTDTGTDGSSGSDGDHTSTQAPSTFDETARSYAKTFNGNAANDNLAGSTDTDRMDGKAGDDTLKGNGGDDAVYGGAGDDKLQGGAGHDYLGGDAGNDKLSGDAGNDKLEGGLGDDLIKGGAGDDWIRGGAGADRLYGDEGADTFVFDMADLDSLDLIYDFNAAEGDRILITGVSASADTSFEIVTRGTNSYLEMHTGDQTFDIARIKGVATDELSMSAADGHIIWA